MNEHSYKIREQERIRHIHNKRAEIKAKLKHIVAISKVLPTPGLSNQAALLKSELRILGE